MAGGEKATILELKEALTNQVSSESFLKRRKSRPTLLVVDDDLAVVALLREVLESWGYEVVSASNGQEGLQVLTVFVINGIVLDLHMPVMSGHRMLDRIQQVGYQVPVLMMSGGSDEATLRQLVIEGAQGYITKPFSLRTLQALAARVFEPVSVHVVSVDAPLDGVLRP